MRFLKQVILSVVILVATLFLWLNYVPGAAAFLDRTGVSGVLGIEGAAADVSNTRRGFGPRGPAQVVVAAVTEATTNDRVDAIGDVRALRSATLRTEVSGEVVQVALETGGFVDKGAVVGEVGSTGNATGPHLHFELHRDEIAQDPLLFLP